MPKLSLASAQAEPIPTELTLQAIRAEIDGLDDELLQLIQHRQRLASRIGTLKDTAPGLKIRPDREAAVIARRLSRATPEARRIATAVWRELMSGGLAAQGGTEIKVWSGARRDVREAARSRFGGSADYSDLHSARSALDAAMTLDTVVVLALDPDQPWWTELTEHPELWVFEGLGRRGPLDPIALAVGRLPQSTLARGATYRVTLGGDSGMEGRREKVLAVSDGRRLCVERDLGEGALDREHGVIGSAAVL